MEDFNKAISLMPDFAESYYYRGTVYARLNQDQRALEDFNQALRLNPYYAPAYSDRAAIYLNHGKNVYGCTDAQKACAFGKCNVLEAARSKGDCR